MRLSRQFGNWQPAKPGKSRYFTFDVCPPLGIIYLHFVEVPLNNFLNIAIIIVSVALVASILLQSKGVGLGGLTGGGDPSGVYSQRRGIEKVLFNVTIALSVVFLVLALISVLISG